MSDIAIKVENISKRYRIGLTEEMHDTFFGMVASWIKSPVSNFRSLQKLSKFQESGDSEDIFWALRDISFEVKYGEILGIIGRNGAGKSTLLKILCQITDPTSGRAIINGRVASLLEVGTGFHQELTGRENTYLNGTILGMKKVEIDRKFDEIVDFSGVKKFIDTPVKRYSSGMKVRLAFAVAAHLDPEILLIDEVLAVGDAEFQTKCLGKMETIAGEGRTVLFVSHNMAAVRMLCTWGVLLNEGRIQHTGDSENVIKLYLSDLYATKGNPCSIIEDCNQTIYRDEAVFKEAEILDHRGNPAEVIGFGEEFSINLKLKVYKHLKNVNLGISFFSSMGDKIAISPSVLSENGYKTFNLDHGEYQIMVNFDNVKLVPGRYSIGLDLSLFPSGKGVCIVERHYPFTVLRENRLGGLAYPWNTLHGHFVLKSRWEIVSQN